MSAKLKFPIETTYINEFVRDGAYGVSWSASVDAQMGRGEFDLTDINHVLKTGYVFDSDMIDREGGLWSVFGRTIENTPLEITLTVISVEYRVKIIFVEEAKGSRK